MTKTSLPATQTARANKIFGAIGIVSNVAGVATLLYSQLELVAIVIAGVALVSGTYLIVRRWGQPLNYMAVFAILILMAGTAVLSIVVDRRGGVIPSPEGPRYTPTPSGTGTPIPSSHKLLYNGKITAFKATTGYDVDKRGVAPLTGAAAEAAPSDIFIDLSDYLRSPAGDMFRYFGSASDAPAKCAQAIAAGVNPQSIDLSGYASGTYCFLTSEGNIGTIEINKTAIIGNSPQDYIDATVLVWAR